MQDAELPLADGTTLHTQIEDGYGILLPIASLDRIESLYLWGKIPRTDDVENSVSSLLEDMSSLNTACTQAAWINLSLNKPRKAREILKKVLFPIPNPEENTRFRIGTAKKECTIYENSYDNVFLENKPTPDFNLFSRISNLKGKFQKRSEKVIQKKHDDLQADKSKCLKKDSTKERKNSIPEEPESKSPQNDYQRRMELIDKLPANRKALNNKAQRKVALEEVLELWSTITPQEQKDIMLILLLNANTRMTQNVCDDLLNREKIGTRSHYSITFSPWEKEFKAYNFNDITKYCPFLEDESGKLYPIHFGNSSAQVLYALALINKCQEKNNTSPVDLRSNGKAFCKLYKLMFDSMDEEAEQSYTELFRRAVSANNATLRAGRMQEYYDKICNELTTQLEYLDENPSPYLIDAQTPVAIPPSKIHLPEEFKQISIC